jgi:hypothetical protein
MYARNSIPVYDIKTMEMFQCAKQFSGIESTSVLVELAFTLQVVK